MLCYCKIEIDFNIGFYMSKRLFFKAEAYFTSKLSIDFYLFLIYSKKTCLSTLLLMCACI